MAGERDPGVGRRHGLRQTDQHPIMFGDALQNGVGIGLGNIPSLTSLPYSQQLRLAVASLFSGGAQGYWFDNSRLDTIFQDAAGTIPGALEAPVGLQLDLSQGQILGTEIVTNGDFSSGTTSWTPTAGTTIASVTGGVSGNCLEVTYAGVTNSNAYQNFSGTFTVGAVYLVTFYVKSGSAGDGLFACGASTAAAGGGSQQGGEKTGTSSSTWTQYSFPFVATATGGSIYVTKKGAAAGTMLFDSISVKKISGNHRSQSTSANRPTLSALYNLLTKTEKFDNAAWTKANGGTGSLPVVTADQGIAPDGTLTADRIVFARGAGATASDYSVVYQTVTNLTTGRSMRGGFYVKSNTGLTQNVMIYITQTSTVIATAAVGNSWTWLPATVTTDSTSHSIAIGTRGTYGGDQNLDILVWGADLRPTDQATGLIPQYQRVDTVSAGGYDTVGYPVYIKYNGSNQFLSTGSIDFSGSGKLAFWSGLRKISDAVFAMLVETSTAANANNGAFAVNAPDANAAATFAVFTKGTAGVSASVSGYAAPITKTLSFTADIAAPIQTVRVNGGQVSSLSTTMGTGNFGNYATYFGMRAGTLYPFNGYEYGQICVGASVSAGQLAATEAYMNGLTRAY